MNFPKNLMKSKVFPLLAPLFFLQANPTSSNSSSLESIVQTQQPTAIQSQITNISSLSNYLKNKGFNIDTLLKNPRFKIHQDIVSYFKNSSEKKAKNLDEYKKIHRFEEKKDTIPYFIERNLSSLREAEQTYGIPKEIISSILAIESSFARSSGKLNPFNAYVSMYVKDVRQDFARGQLQELLTFCKRNKINVFDLKSSYAGAMSYAQFIPSSLNNWFIGSDLYNLNNNILSVANYLSHFKKTTGSLEKAIFRYNPNNFYVGFVMDLAKEAEKTSSGSNNQQKQF